jgi:hypothetical protein
MKKLTLFFTSIYLALPGVAFAETLLEDKPATTLDDFSNFINRTKNIAVGLVGVLIVGAIIYGATLYMLSGGNEEKIKKGKDTITAAIIGLAIVIASYAMIAFVIKSLGGSIG